jgi:hypothetical protein
MTSGCLCTAFTRLQTPLKTHHNPLPLFQTTTPGATGTLLFSRLSAGGARPQAAAIVAALEADGAAGGGGGGEGAACSVTASGGGH